MLAGMSGGVPTCGLPRRQGLTTRNGGQRDRVRVNPRRADVRACPPCGQTPEAALHTTRTGAQARPFVCRHAHHPTPVGCGGAVSDRTRPAHTTALCSPTRSCFLTGRNHHVNRFASITEGAVHRDTLGFRAWQRMVSFSSMQRRQSSRVASRSEPLHRSLAQVRGQAWRRAVEPSGRRTARRAVAGSTGAPPPASAARRVDGFRSGCRRSIC